MSEEKFWNELKDVRAAMLGIGDARHVPMSPYADKETGKIWFITAQGTDLVQATESGASDASLIVTGSGDLHARIEGKAALSQDRAKLEELWNAIASSWFDDINDPDIRLIEVTPTEAEVWATGGNLGFLYEIAKSKVTGDKPDMGDHFTLTF
ncbi:pyridoxamine 5'-phosphate oxidase family protein [Paracoccaceae bacterium GXU_MW_L88]